MPTVPKLFASALTTMLHERKKTLSTSFLTSTSSSNVPMVKNDNLKKTIIRKAMTYSEIKKLLV